jgi:hypothetical protein
MTSYGFLGRRGPVTGIADQTGLNPGNWTIAFTPAILAFTVPEVLIYKINTMGALGSSFSVYIETQQHDVNVFGTQNSWYDDADTLVIRPGENFYLCYSNPATDNTPPVATIFMRYDVDKWGMNYG